MGYIVLHRPGEDNMMLIKITGESVKFIGRKYIQESFINVSLQLYIS